MNTSSFLQHHQLAENPFKAEEARQDNVFARLGAETAHPDFEKITGDLDRPSSAVVFGEKGSGKTAIRLQLEQAIVEHNEKHPDSRCLVVPYDELNPFLDRLVRRGPEKTPEAALASVRLVDHIDGILGVAVPKVVTEALTDPRARRLERPARQDWLVLQALYDRPEEQGPRAHRLRRTLRVRKIAWVRPIRLTFFGLLGALVISAALFAWADSVGTPHWGHWVAFLSSAALTLATGYQVVLDRFRLGGIARHVSRQLRFLDRTPDSIRASLEELPGSFREGVAFPTDDLDDPRYGMLDRLLRAIAPLGYRSVLVLIDRIDEPTLVSGDPERMRSIVWPLFNNKFLQQNQVALKMMLPAELRHELFRQSQDFFQEARLDKQNLVERLQWSGATLYDLCAARLNACLADGAQTRSLTDLFDETVTRQDLVDALDQMRQPRDAFKLMYQLIQEHCSHTTEEEESYRIPRLILDTVRRSQSERLEGLQRGVRPA